MLLTGAARYAVGCALLLAAAPAPAGPVGGRFEMFDIGIDGDRIVGRYLEEQGTGPIRRCAFAFTGTLRSDGRAVVVARTAGGTRATGRLSLRGDELALDLPAVNDFGGCSVPRGVALTGSRTLAAPWVDLARIAAPRARFRATPTGKPGARHVVRGDIVGVLRRAGPALLVDYAYDEGKPVRGWIAAAEARSLGR